VLYPCPRAVGPRPLKNRTLPLPVRHRKASSSLYEYVSPADLVRPNAWPTEGGGCRPGRFLSWPAPEFPVQSALLTVLGWGNRLTFPPYHLLFVPSNLGPRPMFFSTDRPGALGPLAKTFRVPPESVARPGCLGFAHIIPARPISTGYGIFPSRINSG